MIYRYATLGLAVSKLAAIGRFGSEWQRDPRWHVLPCGVNFEPFKEKVNKNVIRRELNISENDFIVGHVGRFNIQKNHEFIIDIMGKIYQEDKNIQIIISGRWTIAIYH